MKMKKGVNPAGIKPELNLALMIAAFLWLEYGQTLVITSISDFIHSLYSRHYVGYAADLRTHYFKNKTQILTVARELRKRLGPDYYVKVEKTHIHLSYRPKRVKA